MGEHGTLSAPPVFSVCSGKAGPSPGPRQCWGGLPMKLHFGTAQGSLFLATAMAGLLAGVGQLGTAAQAQPAQAAAALYNQAGQPVGTVTFTEQSGKVIV